MKDQLNIFLCSRVSVNNRHGGAGATDYCPGDRKILLFDTRDGPAAPSVQINQHKRATAAGPCPGAATSVAESLKREMVSFAGGFVLIDTKLTSTFVVSADIAPDCDLGHSLDSDPIINIDPKRSMWNEPTPIEVKRS